MTDEYTAWKASCARPWAERVRATVGRLEQRQAALDELVALYDGLQASRYDRQGGKETRETGDESTVALIVRIDAMRKDWDSALSDWCEEVKAFEMALRRIDPRHDQLLTARYLRNMRWVDVAKALNMHEVYVRGEYLTEALAALFDAMPTHLRYIPKAFED